MTTAFDVIDGRATWSIEQADCLSWLRALPPKSVDLIFGSPPYEEARLYLEGGENMGISRKTDEWVAWMTEVFAAAQAACKGLVAMVVAGQTRNYRWSAGPALLIASLRQAGLNLRNPPIFKRVGIPGSGGPDWLRGDYEWIVCTSQKGKLPWSDNTAMGHPPKWAPGGAMSHRVTSGARVNQWGHPIASGGTGGTKDNVTSQKKRPSHFMANADESPTLIDYAERPQGKATDGKKNGDTISTQGYDPPAKANPGNVIECLHSLSIIDIMGFYADATQTNPDSILRDLRRALDTSALSQWWAGIVAGVFQAAILQPAVQGRGPAQREPCQWGKGSRPETGQDKDEANGLREVRPNGSASGSSQGRKSDEQRTGESSSPLPLVPSEGTQDGELLSSRLYSAILGEGVLLQALPEIQAVRESLDQTLASWHAPDASSLIHCIVGGGVMGSQLAHLNEAPFPEKLAEFFIRSFAPEGGIVADCFSGSGTTAAVALACGRRAVACDLRASQVQLGIKRIGKVTAPLFAG